MSPFLVLNKFQLLWRSLTPRASCSCQDWHLGHQVLSLWRCSFARGTRLGFSWPLTSCRRGAQSGCTWVRADSAYRLIRLAGPSLSWAPVGPSRTLPSYTYREVRYACHSVRRSKEEVYFHVMKLTQIILLYKKVQVWMTVSGIMWSWTPDMIIWASQWTQTKEPQLTPASPSSSPQTANSSLVVRHEIYSINTGYIVIHCLTKEMQ